MKLQQSPNIVNIDISTDKARERENSPPASVKKQKKYGGKSQPKQGSNSTGQIVSSSSSSGSEQQRVLALVPSQQIITHPEIMETETKTEGETF